MPTQIIPPCATEDSTWCYWNAPTMGNGQGHSFIARGEGEPTSMVHGCPDGIQTVTLDTDTGTFTSSCPSLLETYVPTWDGGTDTLTEQPVPLEILPETGADVSIVPLLVAVGLVLLVSGVGVLLGARRKSGRG